MLELRSSHTILKTIKLVFVENEPCFRYDIAYLPLSNNHSKLINDPTT